MSADNLRVQILDGAIALFIEKGIDKVTTRELTEHLGISRSHIYHYFRDWGSLRLEAAERFMLADLNAFKDALLPVCLQPMMLTGNCTIQSGRRPSTIRLMQIWQ